MTKHNHKILFIVCYVAMPALLAWIGYQYSHYEATKGSRILSSNSAKQMEFTGEESVYKNAAGANSAFYDLPRVSLSMSSNAGGTGMMKLDLSLEVQKEDLKRVIDFEPRIIEKILMFMRQQNYEEFQQPNGARILRQDLEHEIRTGAFPIRIAAVNVREMVFE